MPGFVFHRELAPFNAVGVVVHGVVHGVGIKSAQKSFNSVLGIVGIFIMLKPRRLCKGGIGIICAKTGPVVVGVEIDIFLAVFFKHAVSVNGDNAVIKLGINIVNGVLFGI